MDEPRALNAACLHITGLCLSTAHKETDLLHIWRSYVMYWQGTRPQEEMLGFLQALVAEVRLIQSELHSLDTAPTSDAARLLELFKLQEKVLQLVIVEVQTQMLPRESSNTFVCQFLGGTFSVMELFLCALKQRREAETQPGYEHFNAKFELSTKCMMQSMKLYAEERHAFEELQQQHMSMLRAESDRATLAVLSLTNENRQLRSELQSVKKRKNRLEEFNRQMMKDIVGVAEGTEGLDGVAEGTEGLDGAHATSDSV
jgi:hypothetical protein